MSDSHQNEIERGAQVVSTLVVLIPAHNEAESIGSTIEAMLRQERRADRVALIALGGTMVAFGQRWRKRHGAKP